MTTLKTKVTRASASKAKQASAPPSPLKADDQAALLHDLRSLVQSARQRLAVVANASVTLLCWQVGQRLLGEHLTAGRAPYGKQIVATVSQQLTAEFGQGFSYTALTRMARFAEWMHQAIERARELAARRLSHEGGLRD